MSAVRLSGLSTIEIVIELPSRCGDCNIYVKIGLRYFMTETIDQTKRLLSIEIPELTDKLALTSFSGSEEISRPYTFRLQVVSFDDEITPAKIVGQKITVKVQWLQYSDSSSDPVDKTRYFHGYACRFAAGGLVALDPPLRVYTIEMVSWLWFLSLRSDCRIFQAMTVPEIVKEVIKGAGVPDSPSITDKTKASYPPLDFCVQYRESNFDFISRLMEQVGIFYCLQHSDTAAALVIGDDASTYKALTDAKIEYQSLYGGTGMGMITGWAHRYSLIPGKYSLNDYNFETPSTRLLSSSTTTAKLDKIDKVAYEIFDYPGVYENTGDGTTLAVRRMQELEATYDVVSGQSTCPFFSAGVKFKLIDYPVAAENNKEMLVVSVDHNVRSPHAETASDGSGDEYSNTFSAIPATVNYRPERSTRLPIVKGPQTAVVVGASGDEITTDQYGRVKVQFFWDRLGKNDDKSSCYVRVAQAWGGKNWGLLFTPRVGDEVIVDFLEGNPDRPIIVGSVYNATNLPPYTLADKEGAAKDLIAVSGIKTYSMAKGAAANFNELRFNDKLGKEEIFFHAERDFTREVENNDVLTVGIQNDANGSPAVGLDGKGEGNQSITLFNNQKLLIGQKIGNKAPADGSQTIEIWKNQSLTVGSGKADSGDGSQTIEIWKNQTVTIGKGEVNCGDGSQTTSIFKDQTITIGNNMAIKIGDAQSADGSQTVDIFKDRTVTLKSGNETLIVTQGNQKVQIQAGASLLEAMQSITLKVGENSIKIAPDGITIKGTLITLEAQAAFKAKAPMCDILADGIATIKGGILKLN